MAPFRLGRNEYLHELPWRLMGNRVTMYWRRAYLDDDVAELDERGFQVRRFNCTAWTYDLQWHREIKAGLGLPAYTGASWDALADSLTDMDVPETSGLAVVLDEYDGTRPRDETLLDGREWLDANRGL